MDAGAASPEAGAGRVLRAFLIADIRGYSTFAEQCGIEATSALAARFVAIATGSVADAGGRLAGVRGDQVLAVFESPRDAVLAAVDLQRRLLASTRDDPVLPLPVGIGLDHGEAVEVAGEWSATAVNVAARLCDRAVGGEVLATQGLTDLVHGVDGLRFADRGVTTLKGIGRPVRVMCVAETELDTVAELRALGLRGAAGARRPRPSRVALGVAGALVVAAGLCAAAVTHWDGSPRPAGTRLTANSVGLLSGAGQRRVDVGLPAAPGPIATGAGAVWAVTPTAGTLTRLSTSRPHSAAVSVPVGSRPAAVAVGEGAAWVANSADRTVTRVDDSTLPAVADTVGVGNDPTAVAVGFGRVWVANGIDGTVSVIDPRPSGGIADRVVATVPVGAQPDALVTGAGGVWVALGASAQLVRIDPASLQVDASVGVGNDPSALVVDAAGLWVANAGDATVSRVAPRSLAVVGTVAVGRTPVALAAAGGGVWVADRDSDDVREVRPGGVRRTVRIGQAPVGVASGPGGVWVSAGETTSAHRGGTLRVVGIGDLTTLDPARAYSQFEWNIESVVHDGLVTFQRTGGSAGGIVVPDLAARLPQISPDGRTYTFVLRRGIRFSDGAPVRPSDVRASFERLLRSPSAPPYYTAIAGASRCSPSRPTCDLSEGVRTDDATDTVQLRLSRPDPDLLEQLAIPFADILPAGTRPGDLSFSPTPATGPYVIASATATTVTLGRNPRFVAWSTAAQPPGYPDRIEIRFRGAARHAGPDAEARATVSGAYDWSPDAVQPGLLATLVKTATSQVHGFADGSVHYFFLDTRLAPFTDVRVRRAVDLAVDRGAAVRALGGVVSQRSTCQVIAPSLPGYRAFCPYTAHPDRSGVWAAPDLATARALVRAAHAQGAPVRVVTPVDRTAVGRVMVRAMRAIGLDASLAVPRRGLQAYYDYIGRPADHVQTAYEGWVVDYPSPSNLFGPLLSCGAQTAAGNLDESLFCDRHVDHDIAAARALQVSDPTAAGMRWAHVDREVTERAPWVPLTNGIVWDATSKRLGNFEANPEFGMLVDQAWVR